MYATGNKKMLNMLILEILKKYSDENHALSQQEIIRLLKQNYDMECDRRSVKSNVLSLQELGYDISMDKGYRLMSRDFDDSELRILIDSVLFSKSISTRQAKGLIEKLRDHASNYFNAKVSHVCNLPDLPRTSNKQAMYSLDVLNDAISEKRKISFMYNSVGIDLKLRPKWDNPAVVNPYQIVANNGRFYLIGNFDKYDNVVHLRIDRMTDVKMLDEKAKPMKQVTELKNGLNLPRHMAEHMYMFGGESIPVKIETSEDMIQEFIDWFGNDFSVEKLEDGKIRVRVVCNAQAMRFWALQYGPYIEVTEPKDLREIIIQDINVMAEKYK
ncbi:MAG: WYL domain-containing protein [Lachnospiraceae bacterium]|nr:WYL domain-containing protein [Lachnospiraceae bacterium]